MSRLCVLGPSGRMGLQVANLAMEHADIVLASAVDRPGSTNQGQLIGDSGISVSADLDAALKGAEVYIDFTTPESTARAALAAARHKTAAVVGTTGLNAEANAALDALALVAPVLVAPNFSPGVALLVHLAEKAARALGPRYDLEVVELHHRNKCDAPSGTALALGQALAKGRDLEFSDAAVQARSGQVGPRTDDEIGLVAVRGGDIVGEHTAYFIADEERIELSHRAQKRSVFASGALRAALWLVAQQPGRYDMSHVLGLSESA